MLEQIKNVFRDDRSYRDGAFNEIISFDQYLDMVIEKPWITRNMFQLLYDMIISSGVIHKMSPGKPPTHKYKFFEDNGFVGDFVVFGQQKAKENLVERIYNASRQNEASKRLWILLGPPGSAKSRSMESIKTGLNKYSKIDAGKTYMVLLPTMNPKLKSRACYEENGIYYIQAPCFERPLQIIPPDNREDFLIELNSSLKKESLDLFLESHKHYDSGFKVDIDGFVSSAAQYIMEEFMRDKNISFSEMLSYVKVKRMIFDSKTKTGIGSYTPRDEKSQEAGSLVGNIDYTMLPQFGSESHPLVHDYKGELCVGANGFVEIHEILKLSDRFLYELLFATHDRFFKPEGQPPIPFNGVIIGHTNFHEYNMFQQNEAFEALKKRTVFIEMPFSTDFREEEKIYSFTYSNDARQWTPEKKYTAHVAPHSLELLSLTAVMSRLYESKKSRDLQLVQKALIYAGRVDSGVDNNMANSIIEEFKYVKPSEGTFGLDPRFIQNCFETTEHFQINEFLANIDKLNEEGGDVAMLDSISLRNPCVTPLDILIKMESDIRENYALDKSNLQKYTESIIPQAKKWICSQIANDVYSSILRDDTIVENTWKKYTDHVRAFAHNTTVKHEITQKDVKPDEKFMKSIEAYIGVPDRETFRKELSDAISSVGHIVLLKDEPSYQSAIKKYVFENEFKSGENMKLLGWIKSGFSSADANSKEQQQLNDTIKYLVDNMGYCGKCAHQALIITANSSSIVE